MADDTRVSADAASAAMAAASAAAAAAASAAAGAAGPVITDDDTTAGDSGDDITVNIKTLNGADFELAVPRDLLVSELKSRVRERTGVEEGRQRLIYRGKVLTDTEALFMYKVESGHYVHMVARPRGIPPASATGNSSTSAGVAGGVGGAASANSRTVPRPTNLSDRLLMGMGMPGFAQADGRAGTPAEGNRIGGTDTDNALLAAAAGLDDGNFLSSMLGLGNGAAGGQAAAAGQQTQGARALWNSVEERRVRDVRPGGSAGGGRGAMAAGGTGSSGAEAGAEGQTGLEHVRQGLLTMHTLLSGMSRRSRPDSSWVVMLSEAQEEERSRARISSSVSSAAEVAQGSAAAATQAEEPAAVTSVNAEAADGSPGTRAEATRTGETATLSRGAGARAVTRRWPYGSSLSYPRHGASGRSTPGRAWLPPSSFDDVSEEDGGDEDGSSEGHLSSGSRGSPSRRWPLSGRGSAVSRSSSESIESPPHLVSSSGNSNTSDSWGDRSEGAFPHRSRSESDDDDDDGGDDGDDYDGEQEEKEDEFGHGMREHRRKLKRRFFVGQWLDVKDTVNNWLEATVMDMAESGTKLQIHYNGWPPRWDEWLSWDSPRIAPFRTRTQHQPQPQRVSPAPVSAVRNAPITGKDDVRVVMPEVNRILQEIGPMVDELSAYYARNLEQDPSDSPDGERAVSHILPWTHQRVHHRQQLDGGTGTSNPSAAGVISTDDLGPKTADLAGDVAPLLDRLGRMLTDVAPHLARLSCGEEARTASARTDEAEPGEVPWGARRRRVGSQRTQRSGSQRSRGSQADGEASPGMPDEADLAFRQLVSTSSPAPTSSNINIHIHAIVPLRAPPSPPPPPPPPPPTASASAVATPTRADRRPLAVSGSRSQPWGGNTDIAGGSASLIAAAASRAATSARNSEVEESATTRRDIIADSGRPGGEGDAVGGTVGTADAPDLSRSSSSASSVLFDGTTVAASPVAVSTPGSSAIVQGESGLAPPFPGSPGTTLDSDLAGDEADHNDASGGHHSGGQRRNGAWRGILHAFGVGRNGSSRVSGRRDGSDGDQAT